MDQSQLSPEESLNIIEQAIGRARNEKTGAAFYYILWGIILFLYSMFNFLAFKFPSSSAPAFQSFGWLVFPIGGIISFFQTKRTDKVEKVKPMNESLYKFVWGGVGLCLGVLAVFQYNAQSADLHLSSILLLFGLASFITGGVTKFTPSIIGGVIGIICAGVTLVLPLADQFLVCAIAMLAVNIIPGILMKKTKAIDV